MTTSNGVLDGKVALVTGAGRNIGRQIALRLAAAGADIAVNVRSNEAEGIAVRDEIRGLGRKAECLVANVGDPSEVQAMFETTRRELGSVSVLVNCAAIRPRTPFVDLEEDEWNEVIGIVLGGAFRCSKAAAADMIELGWGRIVNISGRDGFTGHVNRAHGVTAKAGLHGFTKALALELGPHGITVNTVVPGLTRTTRKAELYPDLDYDKRAERIPVRRVGEPDDIARAVEFLITDPGYISGVAIHVNGGESLF